MVIALQKSRDFAFTSIGISSAELSLDNASFFHFVG